MKLKGWDELCEEEEFFCSSCGKQLGALDDISRLLCRECKRNIQKLKQGHLFFCWACEKELFDMGEVAQGLCHSCRASILRKIQQPSQKRHSTDD
jgi:DNA-directed RNA polymerase subunit RPC12/RpoP